MVDRRVSALHSGPSWAVRALRSGPRRSFRYAHSAGLPVVMEYRRLRSGPPLPPGFRPLPPGSASASLPAIYRPPAAAFFSHSQFACRFRRHSPPLFRSASSHHHPLPAASLHLLPVHQAQVLLYLDSPPFTTATCAAALPALPLPRFQTLSLAAPFAIQLRASTGFIQALPH